MSDEEEIVSGVEAVVEDGDGGGRQGKGGETELASKTLQIQSKRFYLDVKQNFRGRFLKMAEVGAGGRKSRLMMSMSVAGAFRDQLTDFVDFCDQHPESKTGASDENAGQLKSESLVRENRRYFLDLKENSRGRFLRISQTIARSPGGPRSQIAIPAQGIVELRDALGELLETYGQEDANDGPVEMALPEGKHLRTANKMFHFDVSQNNRGIFMRISEVKSGYRSSIAIGERNWKRFRDIIDELSAEMKELKSKNAHESEEESGDDDEEEGEEEGDSEKKEKGRSPNSSKKEEKVNVDGK